jgi:hypothetical protein
MKVYLEEQEYRTNDKLIHSTYNCAAVRINSFMLLASVTCQDDCRNVLMPRKNILKMSKGIFGDSGMSILL